MVYRFKKGQIVVFVDDTLKAVAIGSSYHGIPAGTIATIQELFLPEEIRDGVQYPSEPMLSIMYAERTENPKKEVVNARDVRLFSGWSKLDETLKKESEIKARISQTIGEKCSHFYDDVEMAREDKTKTGHVWSVRQKCRDCGETKNVKKYRKGWTY